MAEEVFTEWSRLQEEMSEQVSATDAANWHLPSFNEDSETSEKPPGSELLRYVAGLDTSTVDQPDMQVTSHTQSLKVVYQDFEELDLSIPYRSGYLGFREVPAYDALLSRLRKRCTSPTPLPDPPAHEPPQTLECAASVTVSCPASGGQDREVTGSCGYEGTPVWPQVVLVDGFGVLHHRRCGSASHIGVHCNISTVGVGKTLLHRDGLNERATRNTLSEALQAMRANETALPDRCYMKRTLRGESVVCMDLMSEGSGEVLGVAVAGMHGSQRPLYISRGHQVSLRTAVDVTLACCMHRIPEPIRQADLSSRECVRKLLNPG